MTPSILDSFDPFATHPFTNGSGLVPAPPMPSRYPVLIPSARNQSHFAPTFSSSPGTPSSVSSSASSQSFGSPHTPSHVKAPQPRRMSPTSQPRTPVFVPFRQDTSSPDLVLRKKLPAKSS